MIRVLHLDDSALDAELVRERLSADVGDWRFVHVATGDEFERALAAGGFDLVLTDYNIPGYDGRAAVEASHRAWPDVPIIVISGTASEEEAVAALHSGATDYVFKQRLQRLAPAARRALREAADRRRREEERQRAERDIRELNASLERKVRERTQELEAFSYSVSHDLRGPLHAVSGFAEALEQDCGAQLDECGRHYLRRIRAGAERMDALIEDLLSLSRISRADLVAADVDLSALAHEVVAEVREGGAGRGADIAIRPGLRAHGDSRLLRVALVNLVANACKFSAMRQPPRIEVGNGRDADAMGVFFVRDNGAGFEAASAARLFQPFQRLHSQDQFAGTGIGLAIVRRVIERHGGRVWAEGAPDQGATFYFSLPKRAAASLAPR